MKGVHHEKESKEKSEKDRTTISKEIRNHCFVKPFRGNNEVNCSLLLKPPYVCNGCENSSRCKQPKMLYDAAIADHEYHHNLSLLRANLKVTKDQVAAINDVVSPLMIHKHHSVNHVYVSHPEVLPFSKSTFTDILTWVFWMSATSTYSERFAFARKKSMTIPGRR